MIRDEISKELMELAIIGIRNVGKEGYEKGIESHCLAFIRGYKKAEEQYNKDLSEFAEWCPKNGWKYNPMTEDWYHYYDVQRETTSQLLLDWELETGRRPKP